jgi:hypothetical protein
VLKEEKTIFDTTQKRFLGFQLKSKLLLHSAARTPIVQMSRLVCFRRVASKARCSRFFSSCSFEIPLSFSLSSAQMQSSSRISPVSRSFVFAFDSSSAVLSLIFFQQAQHNARSAFIFCSIPPCLADEEDDGR